MIYYPPNLLMHVLERQVRYNNNDKIKYQKHGADGDLHIWGHDGYGEHGQIACPEFVPHNLAPKVTISNASVSCSSENLVAITTEGQVCGWGCTYGGCLGVDEGWITIIIITSKHMQVRPMR